MTHSTNAPAATVEVDGYRFPPFDLERLISTVFVLSAGERFCVFTDLADPMRVRGFEFLDGECTESQRIAHDTLFRGLQALGDRLGLAAVDFRAYRETGGSNLDLPETCVAPDGTEHDLRDTVRRYSIVLFTGSWSATAPVTAMAKEFGIRGATLHGINQKVLASGLAVDYREVSERAERLRRLVTRAASVRFDFEVEGRPFALDLRLGGQEAQKSHGLVHTTGDVANLPAGEVYFVPEGAEGYLPQKFEDADETLAIFRVSRRGITGVHEICRGNPDLVRRYLATIEFDPNAGQLTELGLGTQSLPFAGCDIQDEKIIGTAHVATGRSDHLGGDIDGTSFKDRRNAMHSDILFAPLKTPEIQLRRVTMEKEGKATLLIESFQPADAMARLL